MTGQAMRKLIEELDAIEARRTELLWRLENLETWTEDAARASHTHPSWRQLRQKGDADSALEVFEQEGAESAFAEIAARIAYLRDLLRESGGGVPRVHELVNAIRAELRWCDREHEAARRARGDAGTAEEIHAEGRRRAFAQVAAELRASLDRKPSKRPNGA